MSEKLRVVKLVAVHQSVEGFEYWDKAGDAIRFKPNVLESGIPIDFYVKKKEGKVECQRSTPDWSASGYGFLGISDVDEDKVDHLGLADTVTIKEIMVFCHQRIPGHIYHPSGVEWSLSATEKEWDVELLRRDEHKLPTNSGQLTVNKDGLIEPVCASLYPVPADGSIIVVSSFRKEDSKLIFEKPSTDISASIQRLQEKEQRRIEEFDKRADQNFQDPSTQSSRRRKRKGRK